MTLGSPSVQWSLLLNVLFGAIASRAFTEFYSTMDAEKKADSDGAGSGRPRAYYPARYMVFAAAFAFYVYDWIVLQVLFSQLPYSLHSNFSFIRFANDIVMAFFLFGIVWYAAIPRTFERPVLILRRLCLWHVMAASWHVLAAYEYDKPLNWPVLTWHLVCVQSLYWCPYYLYRRLRGGSPDSTAATNINSLLILSVSLFLVSVIRTYLVLVT